MRRQLITFSLAFPLSLGALAHEHEHEHEEHTSLGAHEHGVASLNLAIEGSQVHLELDSPAMNLVGFEHTANSPEDQAKVAEVQAQLRKPQQLFSFPAAADCSLVKTDLHSPLFAEAHEEAAEHAHEDHDHDEAHAEQHADEHEHAHADIEASYSFDCAEPAALTRLELPLFKLYPGLERINLQAITAKGQMGAELSAESGAVKLD
ncbi:MAG: DUF2796 domain-containing protein [Halopseudomonas sp.]|uniref:DUF2796 domain-containing protein n=1 Tax=Halopseudomonas sp. TaxID=2901191 RepID=UPI00300290FF